MHRKFIALIVATAVAITGVSVSRAQAADAHDILGGLAAIALLGAAIKRYSRDTRNQNVSRYGDHAYIAPNVQPHRNHTDHIRPLPDRVKRYDLPQRCLKTFDGSSNQRPLLGIKCLKKHYKARGKTA